MPETPDFELIATRVAGSIPSIVTRDLVQHDIAEQLRQVWNARGVADRDAVDEIAHTNSERIDRALRTLDR